MTASDIEAVIKLLPELGSNGNGVEWRRGESRDDRLARVKAEQDHLKSSGPMLSLVAVWLSTVKRLKTVDRIRSSYTYKHDVERNFGRYVSNGQFIAAAVFSGIVFKEDRDGINVFFAMPRCGRNLEYDRFNIVNTPELPGEPDGWWEAVQGTTGEPLWRNVVTNPGDGLARGVMADWLDENGLPEWATWMRLVGHESLKRKRYVYE